MLSAKTQYAVLAMVDLAIQYADGRPVQAARIAERHGIPGQFLLQILHDLKRADLVNSTRGAAGGYRLSKSPEKISLATVVDVFESAEATTDCAASQSPLGPAVVEICRDLARLRSERLASATLASLAESAAVHAEPMWYI